MSDLNQAYLQTFERREQTAPARLQPITQRAPSATRSSVSIWQRFWLRWTTRRALRTLDEAVLKDVGLTRQQALEEAYRPFWRLLR
ncbi:DUF1127 domain-containing protein [Pseudomonas sp. Marseille-QA0892]